VQSMGRIGLGLAIVFAASSMPAQVHAQAQLCRSGDWGAKPGRAKVDFDNNGYVDYCRVSGPSAQGSICCTLSTAPPAQKLPATATPRPKLFGATPAPVGAPIKRPSVYPEGYMAGAVLTWDRVDLGDEDGRAWVDINGDKFPEYCRIVRDKGQPVASCRLNSGGSRMGPELATNPLGPHDPKRRFWVDINRDGRTDFCRVTPYKGDEFLVCDLYNPATRRFSSQITDIIITK
jgi:hypothetical protein